MSDCQKKVDNLHNRIEKGLREIKEKQEDSEFITLRGEEGKILYDLCQLSCSKDGDPWSLKFAGSLLFEGVPVICR